MKLPNVQKRFVCKNSFQYHSKINQKDQIVAGHDVASGGLITTLLRTLFC